MSRTEWARRYVVRSLRARALHCPERYLTMLDATPDGQAIRGLSPWIFLPWPEHTAAYCSEAIGEAVLPFAQALGHDLIACFLTEPGPHPEVVVLNPWSPSKRLVRRANLPSFDIWLSYAFHVSRGIGVKPKRRASTAQTAHSGMP